MFIKERIVIPKLKEIEYLYCDIKVYCDKLDKNYLDKKFSLLLEPR